MGSVAIGVGLMEFPFKTASDFWRWVDVCEESGLDSIWQTDRLVSGAPMLECMSAMAALAGATRRIKFGMNVLGMGTRDPLVVAKECATIDYLSDGRLLPAFGVGSPRSPDWEGSGRTYKGSGKRVDEAMEIMRRLWAGERLDFDGEFYQLRGARIAPLPVQKRLPLWYGGASKSAVRRTAKYCSGWLGGPETPDEAGRVIAAIKAACVEEGTRIDHDHYGAGFFYRFGADTDPCVQARVKMNLARLPDKDPKRLLVVGGATDIAQKLREYVEAGATKFVLRPVGEDADDVINQTRMLAEQMLPEVANMDIAAPAVA
jgi:probable F420-dependent oxidoreductase